MSESEKPAVPRPTENDADVTAALVGFIRGKLRAYLVSHGDPDPDVDEAISDVKRAMHYEFDGYAVARRLDDRGWHTTSELVDLAESFLGDRYDMHRVVIRRWVEAHGITAKCRVTERVRLTVRGKKVEGEIVRIDHKLATYTVFVETLGHVRTGVGTTGVVVPFEDVEKLPDGVEIAVAAGTGQ